MMVFLLGVLLPFAASDGCVDTEGYTLFGSPCADWAGPIEPYVSYCDKDLTVAGTYIGDLDKTKIPESWLAACDISCDTPPCGDMVPCSLAKTVSDGHFPWQPSKGPINVGDGLDIATGDLIPKTDFEEIQQRCGVSCGTCARKHLFEPPDSIGDGFAAPRLLPGYGFCRTAEAVEETSQAFGDNPNLVPLMADPAPSAKTKQSCVSATDGYEECFQECMTDQTCGCFSVSLADSVSDCETKAECILYPRVDLAGSVKSYTQGSHKRIHYKRYYHSYAMAPREVTCKDCRKAGSRVRKLLFGSFETELPCCAE
jgi:hypothetical protein